MKYDFSDDEIFAKGLGDMIYSRADAPPGPERQKLFSVVVVVVSWFLVLGCLLLCPGHARLDNHLVVIPGGWLCIIHLERVDDLLLRRGDPNHWGDFDGETV